MRLKLAFKNSCARPFFIPSNINKVFNFSKSSQYCLLRNKMYTFKTGSFWCKKTRQAFLISLLMSLKSPSLNTFDYLLMQALIINARSMNLNQVVNDRLKSLVRCCCALPLLPQDMIEDGLLSLVLEAVGLNLFDDMDDFFGYIYDTWINSWRFQCLSCCLSPFRTNNCSECANRMLRLRTRVHRPSIPTFMDAIRSLEYDTFVDIISEDMGRNPKRTRRRSAINNDYFILNYTTKLLSGRMDVNTFLHRASTRMFNVFINFFEPPPFHRVGRGGTGCVRTVVVRL